MGRGGGAVRPGRRGEKKDERASGRATMVGADRGWENKKSCIRILEGFNKPTVLNITPVVPSSWMELPFTDDWFFNIGKASFELY